MVLPTIVDIQQLDYQVPTSFTSISYLPPNPPLVLPLRLQPEPFHHEMGVLDSTCCLVVISALTSSCADVIHDINLKLVELHSVQRL